MNIDWVETSKILLTAFASTVFTGGLAFSAQKFIEGWLAKSFEKFKKDLELAAFEHQTRFARLHEKRAEVIAELYARLVRAERSFAHMLDPIPTELTGKPRDERIKIAAETVNDFFSYFEEHRLFLYPELCVEMNQLAQEFREIYFPFMTAQSFPSNPRDASVHESWSKGIDKLNKEIPNLRQNIENRFREMLGDSNRLETHNKE
jgi:hypothetical protein